MRLVFLGVSHWHTPLYLRPAMMIEGVAIAGVSDLDAGIAEAMAAELGCVADTDASRLVERVKPDFAFVLGRHVDMPGIAEMLIGRGIPFAIEKPAGTGAADAERLAGLASRAGAFAAVPLVFRNGALLDLLVRLRQESEIHYANFKFIAGPPTRYLNSKCDWMLDVSQAGGGCTRNLAVHFLDMCGLLFGDDIQVSAAIMSNAAWSRAIEDYSIVSLRSGDKAAVVETGYLYPAPHGHFDLHYSVQTSKGYLRVTDPNGAEFVEPNGTTRRIDFPTTNVPLYRDFTLDVIARARSDKPPLASLTDLIGPALLTDRAYGLAGNVRFGFIEAGAAS